MAYSKAEQFSATEIEMANMAKAIAHPARIAILKYLAEKNECICGDLVEVLPLSQSTVSQHLKALKDAGLISGNIDGPKMCYCLNIGVCQNAWTMLSSLFKNIKCC